MRLGSKTLSSGLLLLAAVIAGGLAQARQNGRTSEAVFPAPERVLKFSHARHRGLACARCHAEVRKSHSVQDRLLPEEAVCRPCHAETRPDTTKKQSMAPGCVSCHLGYTGIGAPRQLFYPAANLRFSHQQHLKKKIDCAACHSADGKQAALPQMKTCLDCHQAKKAPSRCAVCHLTRKDGRLQTRFSSGVLQPSGSLHADRHGPAFYRDHKVIARANREYCRNCHQDKDCLRCHNGSLKPMAIHPGDYIKLHAHDARAQELRCSSCHRYQTFCLGCHQRLGVATESVRGGYRPSTTRAYHPDAFKSAVVGPGHHSKLARRELQSCVSCHRESTCIRCHGTRGLGQGGFSPHPSGFGNSARCKSLSSRNQRVCLKCHKLGDAHLDCR